MENESQHTQPSLTSIDNINISEAMKNNLKFVQENLKGTILGCPDYGINKKPLKDRMRVVIASMSFWALIFNIAYYLAKGMWKKALVFLAINVALVVLAALVTKDPIAIQLAALIVPIIASQCAYYDLYRKFVKQEDFWW